MAEIVGRRQNISQMVLIIVLQLVDGSLADAVVYLIVRLEVGQYAVLLVFHYLIVLVDGKVEGSHQLAVLPRFVNIKLVVEFAVAGQKVYNKGDSTDENQCSI